MLDIFKKKLMNFKIVALWSSSWYGQVNLCMQFLTVKSVVWNCVLINDGGPITILTIKTQSIQKFLEF